MFNKVELLLICEGTGKPGIVDGYGPVDEVLEDYDITLSYDLDKVAKFEVIDTGMKSDGDSGFIESVQAEYIIRNIDTDEHFRVSVTHSSWTDSVANSFLDGPIELHSVEFKEFVVKDWVDINTIVVLD